jgi:uncharacterized membrane protein
MTVDTSQVHIFIEKLATLGSTTIDNLPVYIQQWLDMRVFGNIFAGIISFIFLIIPVIIFIYLPKYKQEESDFMYCSFLGKSVHEVGLHLMIVCFLIALITLGVAISQIIIIKLYPTAYLIEHFR